MSQDAPGAATAKRFATTFSNIARSERTLAGLAHVLLAFPSADSRVAAGVRLTAFATQLFVAKLAQMNREDTELVPPMQQRFTDPQMAAVRSIIPEPMPPERRVAILEFMLPALNVTELSELLTSLPATAPPPVDEASSALCTARVDPARWTTVRSRVGLYSLPRARALGKPPR